MTDKLIFVDASSLAKLGRVGTGEHGELNVLLRNNNPVVITGEVYRELLDGQLAGATGATRALDWNYGDSLPIAPIA